MLYRAWRRRERARTWTDAVLSAAVGPTSSFDESQEPIYAESNKEALSSEPIMLEEDAATSTELRPVTVVTTVKGNGDANALPANTLASFDVPSYTAIPSIVPVPFPPGYRSDPIQHFSDGTPYLGNMGKYDFFQGAAAKD